MKTQTWLRELEQAAPSLCVVPHQRVHVIQTLARRGYAGEVAVAAAVAAAAAAARPLVCSSSMDRVP